MVNRGAYCFCWFKSPSEISIFSRQGETENEVQRSGSGFQVGNLEFVFAACYFIKLEDVDLGLSAMHSIARVHGGRLVAETLQGRGPVCREARPPMD